jgi:putative ABC transport system permease protein
MLAPRWRKVLRDLWQNKTRTLLVTLSIAVGVFAFGTIAGGRVILMRDLRAQYLAVNPASATLFLDSQFAFDQELVDAIARMPELSAAQGRRVINTRALDGSGAWSDIQLIAVPDEPITIGLVEPLSGTWPPPKKQLVLERASLARLDAGVGNTLNVELPNGETRQLAIAGLAYDFSLPPPPLAGKAFAYVSLDTLEWLGQPESFNQLQIVVAEHPEDQRHIWQVAGLVERQLNNSAREVERIEVPTPLEHPAEQILPTVLLILTVLGVMALLLSAFLIINTIGAVLAQQTRQIGVMKAIGASTRQIMALYLGMVLAFGALALLLAVPLGALAAYGFSQYMAGWLNFTIAQPGTPASIVALEVAAGLLVPALTSLYPIASSARLTVRDAISSTGLASGGRQGLLDRLLGHVRFLSRPLRLALRNTFRRKGRLVRTLVALVLAGAVFISVLSVRASLFASLDASLAARRYDLVVRFSQPYRDQRVAAEAARVPGVTGVESWTNLQAQPLRPTGELGDPLTLYALPPETRLLEPNLLAGRWLLPEDGAALVVSQNFLLYKEPQLKLGDRVVLRIEEEDYRFTIVGINKEFVPKVAPAVGYIPAAQAARMLGNAGRGDSLHVAIGQRDEATQQRVARALDTQLGGQDLRISSIKTMQEDRDSLVERFDLITGILSLMAVLIGTVGGLGLMGTMSMNVLERTREIGVLRAIGASDGALHQVIIGEGITVGLIAWGLGSLLSLPLSRLMCNQLGINLLLLPLDYRYAGWAVLIWLGIVTLVSVLASLAPARRAARLTVREVLAYEG